MLIKFLPALDLRIFVVTPSSEVGELYPMGSDCNVYGASDQVTQLHATKQKVLSASAGEFPHPDMFSMSITAGLLKIPFLKTLPRINPGLTKALALMRLSKFKQYNPAPIWLSSLHACCKSLHTVAPGVMPPTSQLHEASCPCHHRYWQCHTAWLSAILPCSHVPAAQQWVPAPFPRAVTLGSSDSNAGY